MIDFGESSLIDGIYTIKAKEFSIACLEEAYQHAIIGYQEPEVLKMSDVTAITLAKQLYELYKRNNRHITIGCLIQFNAAKFNKADIPDNQYDFYWPEDKFNSAFNPVERKQPIVRLIIDVN